MGLISAAIGSVGGVLADQWREYFYCDSLPADVLVSKGQKRASNRSSNTKGFENVITNGSIIAVADGQCMIIVDQGKVAELCAKPGEYVYNSSTEPSIFDDGKLSENIIKVFKNIGKRFTYGGEAPKDQRIYFFNTKEILGNKFGTPSPVPFRVVDQRAGIDIDISVRCFGEYSYRITNPILFYTNVCGNVGDTYKRTDIESQLRVELLNKLQPAFARISELGIRYSAIPAHTEELTQAMVHELTQSWNEIRGIEIVRMGVASIKATEEDEKRIKDMQQSAAFMDPTRAAAFLAAQQGQAMVKAAENSAGAATGFMGLGMTQMMGNNLSAMYAQAQNNTNTPREAVNTWTCSCGAQCTGKFCTECGKKKQEKGWICACGAVNQGRFCQECGKKKPENEPLYRCDKCGWEPADPKHPPKFCPECGDVFDDNDKR